MKTNLAKIFLYSIISMTILGSCNQAESLFEIDAFMDVNIQAGANPLQIHGYESEVIFPFETRRMLAQIPTEEISSINALSAIVFPKFETDADLDFINVIEIQVYDPVDPERDSEIFYFDPIPLGRKTEIELAPSIPDLSDFMVSDRLFVRVEFQFRSPPPRNYELRIDMFFAARSE